MDNIFEELVGNLPLPKLLKIRQNFSRPVLDDIPGAVKKAVRKHNLLKSLPKGATVALTGGSRGIANYALVIKTLVELCRKEGLNPLIVPAMGSHGGATAEGQVEVLAGLGITEELIGAPIKSSMETKLIGHTPGGLPVYIDKVALTEADGIVAVNRVKPHTTFRGDYESGLAKMIAIGLGKQKGAELCHSTGPKHMAGRIKSLAETIIEKTPILFGLALVENAFDETSAIYALKAEEIINKEPFILEEARSNMAGIYFKDYDLLIIDEIGKNISGTGLDPNIVGRYTTDTIKNENWVQRIVVLNLSEATRGNANGIGLADICTRRCYDKIDFKKTYPNSLTTGIINSTRIPLVMDNDRLAIQAAVKTCFDVDKENIRLVRIKNTLALEYIEVSEALVPQARCHPSIDLIEDSAKPLSFDQSGNLIF